MATGLCKSDPASVHYERHRPENTALYRLVQDQAETFFVQVEAETAHGLPDYIKTGCGWAMLFNLAGVNPALVAVSHRPGIESCRHASNNVLDA